MRKYDELTNPNSCLNRSACDEPLFVLCARDIDAPTVVREWANIREATGGRSEKIAEARQCAANMEAWQRTHNAARLSNSPRLEQLARVVYEVNSAYLAALGVPQPSWHEQPDIIREAHIAAVRRLLNERPTSAADQHRLWRTTKLAEGWKPGPHFNPLLKTNPNLTPYAELPLQERIKSELFYATVLAVEAAFVAT